MRLGRVAGYALPWGSCAGPGGWNRRCLSLVCSSGVRVPWTVRAYAPLGLQAMDKEREREKAAREPATEGPNSWLTGMVGGHRLTDLLFYFFNIFNIFYFFILNLKINLCVMG